MQTIAGSDEIPEIVERKSIRSIKFSRRGAKEIVQYSIEDFEQAAGLVYLPGLEFEDEKIFRRVRRHCTDASRKGYFDPERKWLGALYAKQINSHYVADVSIRWIDESLGFGLFAEQDIKASEYIGEYAGVVRKRRPFFRNKNDYSFLYPTSFFYIRKHIIDAKDKGNEIRYANHSDDPNCDAIGVFCDDLFHIILRAHRDIHAHTQITYDYSDRYWKARRRVPNVPSIQG